MGYTKVVLNLNLGIFFPFLVRVCSIQYFLFFIPDCTVYSIPSIAMDSYTRYKIRIDIKSVISSTAF